MAEQTEQKDKRPPAEFVNMVYLGNTFANKGKTKAGKDWTIHKVALKESMDDQFQKNWSVFVPLTGKNALQLDTLKQGESYNFGIVKVTKPNKENVMTTFTNIIWIGEKKEGQEAQVTTEDATFKGNHVTNVNLQNYKEEIEAFVQIYKDTFAEDKRKASHFIVQFMIQYKINVVLIETLYDTFLNQVEVKK